MTCRSPDPLAGPSIGFYCGWNILWTANLLVYNDARQEFKRVRRLAANKYEWQKIPQDSAINRLCWTLDLVFNCRGMAWNWKINGEPSRPPTVEACLQNISIAEATKQDVPITKSGRMRYRDRRQAIAYKAWTIIKAYVWLDLLKTTMNHDAYFWGIIDAAPPSYLPHLISASPTLVSCYRMAIGLLFLLHSIELWFGFPQLLLLVIFTPETLGTSAEAWLYPPYFGNYSIIFTRGLAGFWGDFWHHLPKESLQSSARALTKALNLKPRSPQAKAIELVASFVLSGLFHAASAITSIGPTQPLTKTCVFFAIQPIGILFELVCVHYFNRRRADKTTPKWLAYVARATYTHAWLGLTLPLLAHDLSRMGFLMYEPVPFSIFRGLGLGGPGDTAFCW